MELFSRISAVYRGTLRGSQVHFGTPRGSLVFTSDPGAPQGPFGPLGVSELFLELVVHRATLGVPQGPFGSPRGSDLWRLHRSTRLRDVAAEFGQPKRGCDITIGTRATRVDRKVFNGIDLPGNILNDLDHDDNLSDDSNSHLVCEFAMLGVIDLGNPWSCLGLALVNDIYNLQTQSPSLIVAVHPTHVASSIACYRACFDLCDADFRVRCCLFSVWARPHELHSSCSSLVPLFLRALMSSPRVRGGDGVVPPFLVWFGGVGCCCCACQSFSQSACQSVLLCAHPSFSLELRPSCCVSQFVSPSASQSVRPSVSSPASLDVHPSCCFPFCPSCLSCCVFRSVCSSPCHCLSVGLCLCLCHCQLVRLCFCQSPCLRVWPSLCQSVCQSACQYACQSVSPPVSSSVSPSVSSPVCQCRCVSVSHGARRSVFPSPSLEVGPSPSLYVFPSLSLAVCPSTGLDVCPSVGLSSSPSACALVRFCFRQCLSVSESCFLSGVLPAAFSPCLLLAQEPEAQISEEQIWHCKPYCYCTCCINKHSAGGNLTTSSRGPVGSSVVHPIAYALGPAHARRDVRKGGHGNPKVNGRTGPDYVWVAVS